MLEIAGAAAARPIVLPRSESAPLSPVGEGRNRCISPSAAAWAVEHTQSGNINVAVAATKAAGTEGNTESSRWNDENKAMTEEEMRRWLSSRSTSSASLSPRNAEWPTVTTVGVPGCGYGGGDNQSKQSVDNKWPSRGMWQLKPRSSFRQDHVFDGMSRRKGGGDVECNIVDKETEQATRGYDSPAAGGLKAKEKVERTDDELCGALPTLASVNSTAIASALYRAPGGHSRLTSGATSCSNKPRRDSFGASLQAAIKTSSLSLPRPLVLTHRREGDNGGSSIPAATTASKGPRLELPKSKERRRVLTNRPQITLAELPGTTKRVDGRPLEESPQSKYTEKAARRAATEAALSRHREHTVGLEFDQKSPCPDWMNDDDWQQVRNEGECGTTARNL